MVAVPVTLQPPQISIPEKATRLWLVFALLPIAYGLATSLIHLKATWDDAAITAAFARTWVQTGHIALTPVSQSVEGFSSVLWFLLLSLPYCFTHNPDAGLIWMKLLSAVFFALSIWLTYSIASRQLRSEQEGIICALLFAFCITPLREMQNGMEMNLTTLLLLLLFRALSGEHRRVLYSSAIASLLLLARFESPFLLLLMLIGFLLVGNHRRELFKIAIITISAFLLIELIRHHLFGAWMPNTVYAKRFPPYSPWSSLHDILRTRAFAIIEVLLVLPVPIFAALIRHRKPKVHPAVWALASGCFLFGATFGHNMGPAGRMVEPMLPFLLIFLVGACSFRTLGFTLLLCGQGLVWILEQQAAPYGNATIANVQAVGEAADSIRVSLHRKKIVVEISDVGGSALCCKRLDIIDSGLLANPELAHTGWSGFSAQFRRIKPDVVEAHRPWSDASRIFQSGLLNNYCVVVQNGITLYRRRDLHSCGGP